MAPPTIINTNYTSGTSVSQISLSSGGAISSGDTVVVFFGYVDGTFQGVSDMNTTGYGNGITGTEVFSYDTYLDTTANRTKHTAYRFDGLSGAQTFYCSMETTCDLLFVHLRILRYCGDVFTSGYNREDGGSTGYVHVSGLTDDTNRLTLVDVVTKDGTYLTPYDYTETWEISNGGYLYQLGYDSPADAGASIQCNTDNWATMSVVQFDLADTGVGLFFGGGA